MRLPPPDVPRSPHRFARASARVVAAVVSLGSLGSLGSLVGAVLGTLLGAPSAAAEDPPTRGPGAPGLARPAAGPTAPESPLEIVIDGVAVRTTVRVLGDTDGPAADDLVRVGAYWVPRGPGTRLEFRTAPGQLLRVADDGTERVVGVTAVGRPVGEAIPGGVRVGDHVRYGLAPEADTFDAVGDADLAHLACVRIVRPTPAQVARLARLDLARVVVVDAGGADDPLPALPPTVAHLVLGDGLEGKGPRRLDDLDRTPGLVSLALGVRADDTTDLHPLAGLPSLRALDLGGRDVLHLKPLAKLRALRTLDAAGCLSVDDLRPLADLPSLHTLDVSFTAVTDLAPLARLPSLRALTAVSTRATTLPLEPWPALRTLRAIGNDIAPAAFAAFAARHPACAVLADARATLVPVLAGVTRIRVRTGGTCHRVATHERTLAEVRDAPAIAAFVDALRFAVPEFGDDATDCGTPTFELFVGERMVASLGLHGGVRVRWAGGGWPGDAWLAPTAADALATWAAARGVGGPRAEVAAARRQEAAAQHRRTRWAALLPADVEARLAGATTDDDALAIVFPPTLALEARLALALRLLGAGTTLESRVPELASTALYTAPREALLAAGTAATDDPERRLGFARWLLEVPAARATVPPDVLDRWLPQWLDAMLSDARPEVVADGVALAAVLRRPVAMPRLRAHLEVRAPVLAAGDAADPFLRAETLRLVDTLADTGDPADAARLRVLAAAWPPDVVARLEATLRRVARERALLPDGLYDALQTEYANGGEPGALLAANVPDDGPRVRLAFRLLAAADDLREGGAAAVAAAEVLAADGAAAAAVAAEVARRAAPTADDVEVIVGAGRWLLEVRGGRDVSADARDVVLARAVPRLLDVPQEERRVEVVAALGRTDGDGATALLRQVLEGRRLPPEGGAAGPDAPAEGLAVVFAAAYALLDRGDVASHARIRALAPSFAPPERAWIDRKLAEPAPGREARPPTAPAGAPR